MKVKAITQILVFVLLIALNCAGLLAQSVRQKSITKKAVENTVRERITAKRILWQTGSVSNAGRLLHPGIGQAT